MYENNEFDNNELNNNESKTLNEDINNEVPVEQNVEESPNTNFVLVDSSEKEESASAVHSSAQPFSAKDIQPRKKTGLGKKIAVLCLSGLLFGACAAGAYLGIMSLTGGIPGKQQIVQSSGEMGRAGNLSQKQLKLKMRSLGYLGKMAVS